jgi:hypothetical protein
MDASVAQSTTDFERMIGSMRERLRPTRTRLFVEWLRTYVGLNCAGASMSQGGDPHSYGS